MTVTFVAVMAGCVEDSQTPVVSDELTELPETAFGMQSYVTADGIRTGVIRADTAYNYTDSARVELRGGVTMTLFHEDGRERARITAERGTIYSDSERMTVRGNVIAHISEEDQRIESPELHYLPGSDLIRSDSTSVWRHAGGVTRGSCFESDLNLQNIEICAIRGDPPLTEPDTATGEERGSRPTGEGRGRG